MLKMFLIGVILALSFSTAPERAWSMPGGEPGTQQYFKVGEIEEAVLAPVSECKNAAAHIGCPSSPLIVPIAMLTLQVQRVGTLLKRLFPAHGRIDILVWSPVPPPPKWMLF